MTPTILEALQKARQAHAPAVLIRTIGDHQNAQTLWIEGKGEIGEIPLDETLRDAIKIGLQTDKSTNFEHNGARLFLQVFLPPLRLFIVGAAHIAQALVPMAIIAGYAVTVIDPRRAWASAERFPTTETSQDRGVTLVKEWPDEALEAARPDPRSAIVALTHDPKIDDPALDYALKSPAFYIGALGSKATHQKRLMRLSEAGFEADAMARIHGPIGLDIGARTPAEIALAILADMTATLRGRGRE